METKFYDVKREFESATFRGEGERGRKGKVACRIYVLPVGKREATFVFVRSSLMPVYVGAP